MTFPGFFAIFFAIMIIIKKKYNFIIDPMFYMLMIFILFFGQTKEIVLSEKSELILTLSFFIFFGTTYFIRNRELKFLVNYFQRKTTVLKSLDIKPLTGSKQFFLFLIVLTYITFDLSLNTWLYGSFEKAVTRFYFRLPEIEDAPTYLSIIQFSLYSVSSLILFVLSYNNSKFNTSSFYTNLSFLALALVAFPRGTRGAIIVLLIIIILAKIISNFSSGLSPLKGILFSPKVLYPVLIVLLMFLALSSIRNKEIDNLDMLKKTITEMDFSQSQKDYSSTEGDLLLKDYELSVDKFGNTVPYLPLNYTLKAVLLNPIPRSVWKEKPVGFGVALTEVKLGGQNFEPQHLADFKWSNAAGVAGEGWANNGIYGVILYSFLMGLYAGILLRLVDAFLLSENYYTLLIGILSFLASLLTVRGDILSGITQGLYQMMFFLFIIFFVEPFIRYKWSFN